jgi:hypothetical protein
LLAPKYLINIERRNVVMRSCNTRYVSNCDRYVIRYVIGSHNSCILHSSSSSISQTLGMPFSCFPHVSATCSIACCMHSTSSRVYPTRRHPRRCHFVAEVRPWHMMAGIMTSSDSTISRVVWSARNRP